MIAGTPFPGVQPYEGVVLLHSSNVQPVFKCMRCKAVAEGVRAGWFGDSHLSYCLSHRALKSGNILQPDGCFPTGAAPWRLRRG